MRRCEGGWSCRDASGQDASAGVGTGMQGAPGKWARRKREPLAPRASGWALAIGRMAVRGRRVHGAHPRSNTLPHSGLTALSVLSLCGSSRASTRPPGSSAAVPSSPPSPSLLRRFLLAVPLLGVPPMILASALAADATVHPEIWPEVRSPLLPDPAVEARIDALMAKMSVEDKVGQMI